MGAAVAGYTFAIFSNALEIRNLARTARIGFEDLWKIVRTHPPITRSRLIVYGELLQVLGEALLKENYRTRQYEHSAAIVDSCEDAILSEDLNGIITGWNAGAQRLFGYTAQEAIGRPASLLIPPDHPDEQSQIAAHIRRAEPVNHRETVRRHKDGTLLEVSLTVSPIFDPTGAVTGASDIAHDITARKEAEQRLREAKQQAEMANHAKDRFLAVLSHELRTPLTPVVMTLAAMESDAELSLRLRNEVAMIRRNIELESRLIDDLLDLSRVINGKLRLQVRPTHVHHVLRQTVQNCMSETSAKKLNVSFDLQASSDLVEADPARLQQLFWNLLRNSVKFTPENGEIRIRSQDIGEGKLRVEVHDTGIGIASQLLPRIFDAFEQGNRDAIPQFGGLGLGLAISKAIVEMHGGTIRADSRGSGKGATFTVELPTTTPLSASSARHAADARGDNGGAAQHCRILLVEDHPDTARVLARLLSAPGHAVKTADSVATALQLAAAEPFDVLLSDLGLPDGTGYELMQQIRDCCGAEIKGIALSGYGMEEDMCHSKEAGFTDHVVKPVNLQHLEAVIQRVAQTPP